MHNPHWGHMKHSWAYTLYVKQGFAEEKDAYLPTPIDK